MKRVLLLLLTVVVPSAVFGCEEIGVTKRKPAGYPQSGAGNDAGPSSEDEGGIPTGPGPTFTAQPGDIQI